MGSWVCLPSGVGSVTVSGALPRRALSALLLQNPISLLPSYQFHHNRRRVCASASSGAKELQQQQYLRSPDLVGLEYADLNLTHKISEELGHVRIRQHVNPLSSSLSVPVEVPDWNQVFRDPTLPLMVDIGCGSGRFLIWLAKRNLVMRNYLGLEIRKKVFIQSDVLEVALDMRNQFDSQPQVLKHIHEIDSSVLCDSEGWVLSNPMGIRTEREIHAEFEGAKIYRRIYQKQV